MSDKPKIALFQSLARSGCTVVSRHIGAMQSIMLFSEIHPEGPPLALPFVTESGARSFNLYVQATNWFSLYGPEEMSFVQKNSCGPNDLAAIEDVVVRVLERGSVPVIRDWSHIDYHGEPFTRPTYRSAILSLLEQNFTVKRAAMVRHPMAHFMSLVHLALTRGPFYSVEGFDRFVVGILRFADTMPADRTLRFEDFIADKAGAVQKLAGWMEIPFDADVVERAKTFNKVTGDPAGMGRQDVRKESRAIDPQLWAYANKHPGYIAFMDRFGYERGVVPDRYHIGTA